MQFGSSIFAFLLFVVVLIVIVQAIRVVPQQRAWVVERWGKFHAVLEPGLNFVVPFIDRIAYRHDLREIPLDVPPQVVREARAAGRSILGPVVRLPEATDFRALARALTRRGDLPEY